MQNRKPVHRPSIYPLFIFTANTTHGYGDPGVYPIKLGAQSHCRAQSYHCGQFGNANQCMSLGCWREPDYLEETWRTCELHTQRGGDICTSELRGNMLTTKPLYPRPSTSECINVLVNTVQILSTTEFINGLVHLISD